MLFNLCELGRTLLSSASLQTAIPPPCWKRHFLPRKHRCPGELSENSACNQRYKNTGCFLDGRCGEGEAVWRKHCRKRELSQESQVLLQAGSGGNALPGDHDMALGEECSPGFPSGCARSVALGISHR